MTENLDIIVIGEGLIELSSLNSLKYSDNFEKYYGGDALTSSIVAKRLGSKTGFITRVGNDYFKEYLLESWQMEGIDISQVKIHEGNNGVYLVGQRENGVHEYANYRIKTAAANLNIKDINENYIKKSSLIYTTGMAQRLSLTFREAVVNAFKIAHESGVKVAYACNYHSEMWSCEEAKELLEEVIDYVDILFLSKNREVKALYDIDSPDRAMNYFVDRGIKTICIRGLEGYWTVSDGESVFVPKYLDSEIDSTGSADVYNGAFLHGMTSYMGLSETSRLAAVVAGLQAQGIGAIKSIPDITKIEEHLREYNG